MVGYGGIPRGDSAVTRILSTLALVPLCLAALVAMALIAGIIELSEGLK